MARPRRVSNILPQVKWPRLGLCCQFIEQPIKFRFSRVAALQRLPRRSQLTRLAELCTHNAKALHDALVFCADHGIQAFRIRSQILPVKTHPIIGYRLEDLPGGDEIILRFQECGQFAASKNIRTGFHPDQFVVLSSSNPEVIKRSIADIEAHAELAEWANADTINIHAGGAYGDKRSALENCRRNFDKLSSRARSRLTVENDDKVFTPEDLLPLCQATSIPLVYDAHHHRCLPDDLSIEAATKAAIETWNREPLFHLSSPLDGWNRSHPERHHDYINPADFPKCWKNLKITVEIEAKAKE